MSKKDNEEQSPDDGRLVPVNPPCAKCGKNILPVRPDSEGKAYFAVINVNKFVTLESDPRPLHIDQSKGLPVCALCLEEGFAFELNSLSIAETGLIHEPPKKKQ